MGALLACLALGLSIAITLNIPEIRDTFHNHDTRPRIGAAFYIASTTVAYGLALWIIVAAALLLKDVVQFMLQRAA